MLDIYFQVQADDNSRHTHTQNDRREKRGCVMKHRHESESE